VVVDVVIFVAAALAGVITVGHGHGHDLCGYRGIAVTPTALRRRPKSSLQPLLAGAMVEPRSPSHFGPTRCEGNPLPCAG